MAVVALAVGTEAGTVYCMANENWERCGDEGWDCFHDFDGLPETQYPTREACEQAIKELT